VTQDETAENVDTQILDDVMNHGECYYLRRLICTLAYFSVLLYGQLINRALSISDYGSDSANCNRQRCYSDDDELLRNFYISDDEKEEMILRALESYSSESTVQNSETNENLPLTEQESVFSDDVINASMNDPDIVAYHKKIRDERRNELKHFSDSFKSKQVCESHPQPTNLPDPSLFLPISQSFRLKCHINCSVAPSGKYNDTQNTVYFPKLMSTTTSGTCSQQHQTALEVPTTPWVRQFLSRCHRDVLLPIPKDFCADNFNLILLPPVIEQIGGGSKLTEEKCPTNSMQQQKRYPVFRQALRLLTNDDPLPTNIPETLEEAVTALYLLLHQRYIISPRGLDMIRRRFLLGRRDLSSYNNASPIFGRCPNLSCQGMPLLPIGDSDQFRSFSTPRCDALSSTSYNIDDTNHRAKRYCAVCGKVYYHWDSKVDGCAWGTSFCHLFLMVCGKDIFGDWSNHQSALNRDRQREAFVAEIFGFRIHPSAYSL
jgi:Casein kinase II regulatory subunit